MNIIFFCQNCGARFEVEPRLAGKTAQCRQCSERMHIPAARPDPRPTPVTGANAFRLANEPSAPRRPAQRAPQRQPARASWIDAVNSQVALAPLVEERAERGAPVKHRTVIDDDLGDSKPYAVVKTRTALPRMGTGAKPASRIKTAWRHELGSVQRVLRWLNDAAYLISVPFIIVVLLGAVFKNRPMAILGATVVVLLNVSRLGTGLFNLVLIPFKDSPVRGVLFLVPPFTFLDLYNHWKQLRKPLRRVVEPALTIGLVVLTFAFVPSLRSGDKTPASIQEKLLSGAQAVEQGIDEKVSKARNLDLEQLGEKAASKLRNFSPASKFGGTDPEPTDVGQTPSGPPR